MRIDQDGISLWFGTADAPAPAEGVAEGFKISLTIAVQPLDASNGVEVLYRIDGGPVQALPDGSATTLRGAAGAGSGAARGVLLRYGRRS